MTHTSDCAVHNMPAKPNGPCDCGAWAREEAERLLHDVIDLVPPGHGQRKLAIINALRRARSDGEAEVITAERRGRIAGLKEAAEIARGPVIDANPSTGEARLCGNINAGNWSVPQPIAGYKGSDYGTGRYDGAEAIRARATALEASE